jgi:hypothetical protein
MTVKVYDKLVDLIARDGCKPVGTRLSKIVGSSYRIGDLEKRVRKARASGLSRLEVSFYFTNVDGYRFNQASLNTVFHHDAHNLITEILISVINTNEVLPKIYGKIKLTAFLSRLSQLNMNTLVIGYSRIWLILC